MRRWGRRARRRGASIRRVVGARVVVMMTVLSISYSTSLNPPAPPPPHLSNNLIIELHFTIHLLHRHTGRVAPYLVIEITLVGQPL